MEKVFIIRSFREMFQSFRKIFAVFGHVEIHSDVFGPAGMHSDALGWIWKRLDLFDKIWNFSLFDSFTKIFCHGAIWPCLFCLGRDGGTQVTRYKFK